jgi:hypothetical protein
MAFSTGNERPGAPALIGLAPWLLFSLALHVGAMLWAPHGAPWGCCGEAAPQPEVAIAPPALSVRLSGANVSLTAAAPAEKPTPGREAHRQDATAEAGSDKRFLPYYFASRELDSKPEASTEIRISGQEAMEGTAPGNVVLELFINETGRMDSVRVESATLSSAFQDLARDAFLMSVFTPGYKDGMPVKSRLRVEVRVEDVAAPDAERAARAVSAG